MILRIHTVAALLGVLLTLDAGAGEIPDRLQSVDSSDPLAWISETEFQAEIQARDVGSQLAGIENLTYRDNLESLLDQYARHGGEAGKAAKFALATDGSIDSCEPWELSYHHDSGAKDIAGLVSLSAAILTVRVVGSKPGILWGSPGELLEVEVLEILKDAPTVPRDGFYLFNYYARMVFDGRPLCLGEKPIEPGEYVLFIETPWHSNNKELFSSRYPLPILNLDFHALVAGDGTTHGTLFDDYTGDPPEKLVRQLESLDSKHQQTQHTQRFVSSHRGTITTMYPAQKRLSI